MAETEHNEPKYVTFLDANGNEISNDPRWHAERTLKNSGVDVAALQARIAELEAQNSSNSSSTDDDLEKDTDPDLDDQGNRTYKELDGKGLKALAEERGVDITGLKKVGEVRTALIEADAKA